MVGRESDRKKNCHAFSVSPSFTVATEDYAMLFLTQEHCSGTGKSKIHTWGVEGFGDLLGPNSCSVFFQDRSSKSFENSTIKNRQERQEGGQLRVSMAPESLEVFYLPVAYGACSFPQLVWFIYESTACCFCCCPICLPWM